MKYILSTLLFTLSFTLNGQDSLVLLANEAFINQDFLAAKDMYENLYKIDSLTTYKIKAINAEFLLGNLKGAKQNSIIALQEIKDTLAIYPVLGKIYEAEGSIPLAIKCYKYLCAKDSTNLTFLKKLASIYKNNELDFEAKVIYEKIIEINDKDIATFINLTEAYLNLEKDSIANSVIDKAISIDSNNINVIKMKARTAYNLKDYFAVVNNLEKISGQTSLSSYLNNIAGISYMYIDSLDKAIFHLIKSFNNPEYREYGSYYIATIYEKKKMPKEALAYYDRAILEGISKFSDIYYKRKGELYAELERYDEAVESFQKALFLQPNKPEYQYLLGQTLDLKQDAVGAVTYYNNYLSATDSVGKLSEKVLERLVYLKNLEKK